MAEDDKARNFFHQTLDKLREEKERERESEQNKKDRKTSAYASLNQNIAENRGVLSAIQDVKMYEKAQKDSEREEWRNDMLKQKLDPGEEFLREERFGKYKDKKKAFEKKTKEGKEKILERIIQEEKSRMKKEDKQTNLHWIDKYDSQNIHGKKTTVKKLPRVKLQKRPHISGGGKKYLKEPERVVFEERGKFEMRDSSEGEGDKVDENSSGEEIAPKPEYRGLWDIYSQDKDKKKKEPKLISDESMQKAMEKLKTGIVRKQVAAGREFKGQPFRSQPDIIIFKDFEVEKSYQKKVQLTNVSYTVNYCKFVEITDNLKYFCSVEFDPPGSLSAGLTCWFQIKFTPRVDRDLEGAVCFLTQTGPFEIPVKCLKKKCIVSLEIDRLDFGRICKGEKSRKSIQLKNEGIIPTDFTIGNVTLDETMDKVQSKVEIEQPQEQTDETMDKVQSGLEIDQSQEQKDEIKVIAESKVEIEQSQEKQDEVQTEGSIFDIIKTDIEATSYIKCLKPSGHLAGYSECDIDFEFTPDEAGVEVRDFAIKFIQEGVEPIICTVCAESVGLPVWLEKESLDLRICTVGYFYQDSITIHNQATNSMNVSTDIPNALSNFIHILPKNALVQGQNKLNLQLQFNPTLELLDERYNLYFDSENGEFRNKFNFICKGQTLPLPFTLTAILTRAEISFDKTQINFGTCHMQESVVSTVQLTNHSLLPQKIGFISVPQYITISPNDGFITLLPKEEYMLRIAFIPDKIRLYEFSLTCKTEYDKDYTISCTGKAVQSGLQLSHTKVTFRSTDIDDFTFADVHISNPRTARLSSAKVRGVAPVNSSRVFQFQIPDSVPIRITPDAGILATGEECKVSIEFSPVIPTQEIIEQARENLKEKEKEKEDLKSVEGGTSSRTPTLEKKSTGTLRKSSKIELDIPKEIKEDSPDWFEAKEKLLSVYQEKTDTFRIHCFVSIATQSPKVIPDETLQLEVILPSNKPLLKLNSLQGKCVEFGECLIGMKIVKNLELENISDHEIVFKVVPLNINGPFEVINAPRPISPGKTFNLIVNFVPQTNELCHEQCIICYNEYNKTTFFLSAKGVTPALDVVDTQGNPIGEELLVGDVVLKETLDCVFSIANDTSISCDYWCDLTKLDTGKNFTGIQAFNICPIHGEIAANSKKDITINFTPDRPSLLFCEEITIKINKKPNYFTFKIKGRSLETNMYPHHDYIHPMDIMMDPHPKRYSEIIKLLVYRAGGKEKTVRSTLKITNVKHRTTGFKPNGDFTFEMIEPIPATKAFLIEPMKSAVEVGTTFEVNITFDPKQLEPGNKRQLAYYKLTLKGDVVKQYTLLLRGVDATFRL